VRRAFLFVLLLLASAGCSEPPQKEIDQAQAALDSARAAKADTYAASDYTAAADALQKSRDAVAQRDYRQALNYAIDARQRAQAVARLAGDARTRAKRAIEALYGEIATRTNRLQALLRTAEVAHTAPKELRDPRATLAEARTVLQEASAAISQENYEQGTKLLTDVRGKLDASIQAAERIPPRASRPGRVKRPNELRTALPPSRSGRVPRHSTRRAARRPER
jgi:hypothetical protein